jgi:uncharacterized membrane protein (DUF106 family)
MSDPYLIINLSNVLGYFLESIVGFVLNMFVGWNLILTVLMAGMILTIYFRFFKKTAGDLSRG